MGGQPRGSEVLAAAKRATDAAGVFARVSARLRHAVPHDAAVWAATDPETGLITAPTMNPRIACMYSEATVAASRPTTPSVTKKATVARRRYERATCVSMTVTVP